MTGIIFKVLLNTWTSRGNENEYIKVRLPRFAVQEKSPGLAPTHSIRVHDTCPDSDQHRRQRRLKTTEQPDLAPIS
jgi:hypothetical protein